MSKRLVILPALTLMLHLGCGSGSPEPLRIDPQPAVVRVEERLSLRAEALEDLATEPEWELQELHGGGLLRSRGLEVTYLAPPTAGTYHLVLRAQRTDGRKLRQVFPILVQPRISIEPAGITVAPGGTQAFTAKAKGLGQGRFTWILEEPEAGSVTADGQYTASQRPGTYHLTALLVGDSNVSATATITVQ